jgi:predicted TIM-barrel fold metal-dependent hydrolase
MIIDAQIHVWKAETPDRPWRSPVAHLPEPFGYEDLLRLMEASDVDRAVLVPPGWEGGRSDFALEGAARYPDHFAVMGRIPFDDPENAKVLARWKEPFGMLGLRVAFQKKDAWAQLTDGTTDWLWPAAEAAGLPIMLFAPGQVRAVSEIARAHPRLPIIFDHMGLLREKDASAVSVIESIMPLADLPNMHVKLTSVPFYSTEPYPYRNLHDALARLIRAFGPRRAFWGTDITRIWSLCTYSQCVTLFTEDLPFLSAEDLDWIMGRGLAECLRWPLAH